MTKPYENSDDLKKSPRHAFLKEALDAINDLSVPEALQEQALIYLLGDSHTGVNISSPSPKSNIASPVPANPSPANGGSTGDLRNFMKEKNLKTAAKIIPCLFYWAKHNEGKDTLDGKDLLELFRRSSIRPPQNIAQAMRDLTSKHGRLSSVKGEKGHYELTQAGEDFVLYDVAR